MSHFVAPNVTVYLLVNSVSGNISVTVRCSVWRDLKKVKITSLYTKLDEHKHLFFRPCVHMWVFPCRTYKEKRGILFMTPNNISVFVTLEFHVLFSIHWLISTCKYSNIYRVVNVQLRLDKSDRVQFWIRTHSHANFSFLWHSLLCRTICQPSRIFTFAPLHIILVSMLQ